MASTSNRTTAKPFRFEGHKEERKQKLRKEPEEEETDTLRATITNLNGKRRRSTDELNMVRDEIKSNLDAVKRLKVLYELQNSQSEELRIDSDINRKQELQTDFQEAANVLQTAIEKEKALTKQLVTQDIALFNILDNIDW